MGFILKVDGSIELGLENIRTVDFKTDIPKDSNARSSDMGSTLRITGKILTAVGGAAADATMQLGQWSLVPAENADCYRNLNLQVISASQVVREITFPNAFVVDYTEDYGDTEGVGTFVLVVKQKKDKLKDLKIEGGFEA